MTSSPRGLSDRRNRITSAWHFDVSHDCRFSKIICIQRRYISFDRLSARLMTKTLTSDFARHTAVWGIVRAAYSFGRIPCDNSRKLHGADECNYSRFEKCRVTNFSRIDANVISFAGLAFVFRAHLARIIQCNSARVESIRAMRVPFECSRRRPIKTAFLDFIEHCTD